MRERGKENKKKSRHRGNEVKGEMTGAGKNSMNTVE
jgi:hypothetical protein